MVTTPQAHTPRVSVIVAVYRAEAYLAKCVDSLLAQTLRDFEIVLVDDGSPDRSGAMCDAYAAADPRCRVVHKANGGVATARQAGIDAARGVYTIHVDPDDYVEPRMLEDLVTEAERTGADVVLCDYYVQREGRDSVISQRIPDISRTGLLRAMFQQLQGSCCNKLVTRACYSAEGVRFPEGMEYGEDLYVNIATLLLPTVTVAYVPRAYYHYVQDANPNSMVRTDGKTYLRRIDRMHEEIGQLVRGSEVESLWARRRAADAFALLYRGLVDKAGFRRRFGDLRPLPVDGKVTAFVRLALINFTATRALLRIVAALKKTLNKLRRR